MPARLSDIPSGCQIVIDKDTLAQFITTAIDEALERASAEVFDRVIRLKVEELNGKTYTRKDIKRMFGIRSDQTISAYEEAYPSLKPVKIGNRCVYSQSQMSFFKGLTSGRFGSRINN